MTFDLSIPFGQVRTYIPPFLLSVVTVDQTRKHFSPIFSLSLAFHDLVRIRKCEQQAG